MTHRCQTVIPVDLAQAELGFLRGTETSQHTVEEVVVTVARLQTRHTRLLQQIDLHTGTDNLTLTIVRDHHVLTEPRGVIIPHSLGIPKTLERD